MFAGASAAAGPEVNADARLNARLTPPGLRYEIKAGDVISAALVTALNSHLEGRVIAQVTAPVFDSVTGWHLLISQGSRLIGTYDSGTRYGDNRILLVWNRLILAAFAGRLGSLVDVIVLFPFQRRTLLLCAQTMIVQRLDDAAFACGAAGASDDHA